jgi:Helix-turn-helix domain
MGLAVTHDIRHAIIKAYSENPNYASLSRHFNLNYQTVSSICKRYKTLGDSGILPQYYHSGRKVSFESEVNYRLIRLIKYLHPTWGIGYILHQLDTHYPHRVFQTERHYQRRLAALGSHQKKTQLPNPKFFDRARTAHETWQIDAKEQFSIVTGEKCCYLNITDEATGSILGAKAFPPCPN